MKTLVGFFLFTLYIGNYCFRCTINPHQAREGGEAVSRDILLYISFIVYWVGPPFFFFFLKTSYQDPLFYFSHKHTVCHFRPFTKSDFVGRTDLWINLRIEVDPDSA